MRVISAALSAVLRLQINRDRLPQSEYKILLFSSREHVQLINMCSNSRSGVAYPRDIYIHIHPFLYFF